MLRLFTICAAAGVLIPSAYVRAEPSPCKPAPGQFCFDLPEQSNTRRPSKQQNSEQRRDAPLPNVTHDRRLKLDDDTSFGLGGRGLGVKRSF